MVKYYARKKVVLVYSIALKYQSIKLPCFTLRGEGGGGGGSKREFCPGPLKIYWRLSFHI